MAENVYFEEMYDGVLSEEAESFQAEINITSKEEVKTVEKSHFVELSEDNLDVIIDRAEAQTTKNTTKWGVKVFEGKHKTIEN